MEFVQLLCYVFLAFLEISHTGFRQGYAAAASVPPEQFIRVTVPDLVKADEETTLGCDMSFEPEDPHIKKVTWKRKPTSQFAPGSNVTLILEMDVILVTYTYTSGASLPGNTTYWASPDTYTLTPDYGLTIKKVTVQDEGAYCCEVLTADNVQLSDCAIVTVTVLPTLAFKGTKCEAQDKVCKTYGHIGENFTCVARQYRPFVQVKLKWSVNSLSVPLYAPHTKYRNYTQDGVLYYEAFSTVEFSKAGNYKYTCTAYGTKCGKGGCSVSDVVIVSRKHHLALWWLIVPLLAVFVILFVVRWRKQSASKPDTVMQPPNHVYQKVTTVELAATDPLKEKL